ncbi:uncharacterized protein LOC130966104 [Arachis stenosperma]|uniref:uncharacterized protein LOC130966104 n=1 Tax=Arachis stenosperma TaxID=217475 RepID=UPI0025AB719C|nr:uncharacterized protein LOC130966104 [Arachis stenosperma]
MDHNFVHHPADHPDPVATHPPSFPLLSSSSSFFHPPPPLPPSTITTTAPPSPPSATHAPFLPLSPPYPHYTYLSLPAPKQQPPPPRHPPSSRQTPPPLLSNHLSIKDRGWFFLERKLIAVNASWVREFYCNYFNTSLDAVILRGKQILVTKEAIEDILQLPHKSDQPDGYKKAEEDMRFMKFDWDAVKARIALDPTVPWEMGQDTTMPKGIKWIYLNDEA